MLTLIENIGVEKFCVMHARDAFRQNLKRQFVRVSGLNSGGAEAALRERFVVDEEEDEKDGVGSGEGDTGDHIDGFRHTDRVRRFFFANLDETWLKEINLQMNDDTESQLWGHILAA